MPDRIVGFMVLVYDCGEDEEWHSDTPVLHQQEFPVLPTDEGEWEALHRADDHACLCENSPPWEGRFVDVDTVCELTKEEP